MTQETEHVELTVGMFQAALNMTSSPDHYTDKTKAFVTRLHKAEFISGGRWKVELDESGMESLIYVLGVYCLNRSPMYRTRFKNYLAANSELYSTVSARLKAELAPS